MLPFSFTLTRARACSEERMLTSGQAQAPCFPSPSPWPEPARSQKRRCWLPAGPKHPAASKPPLLQRTRLLDWEAWGVPAFHGPFLALLLPSLCPLADARRAPDRVPGPGANSSLGQRAPPSSRLWRLQSVPSFLPSRAEGTWTEVRGRGGGRHRELLASAVRRRKSSISFSAMVSVSEENSHVFKAW